MSLAALVKRFEEISKSEHDFFLGIYLVPGNTQGGNGNRDNRLIGTMIGSVVDRALWIKLLTVDSLCRRKGLGSMSISLILDFVKSGGLAWDAYLSVVESNRAGLSFWHKNGFSELKRLEKKFSCNNEECDIIIMQRKLI